MLLGGDLFLVGTEAAAAFSATTGAPLWRDELWALTGWDGGAFQINTGALSNQGLLSLVGISASDGAGSQLLTLFSDGALDYVQQIPGAGLPPYTLLADRAGNTYFASGLICPNTSCGSASAGGSFDSSGRLRFPLGNAPTEAFTPLAVGADYLLAAQTVVAGATGSRLSAFGLDGTPLYDAPTPLANDWWVFGKASGAVIDAAGMAYVVGRGLENPAADQITPPWEIEAVARSGASPWLTSLPAGFAPLSTPALGAPGGLFLELQGDGGVVLAAFDTATGAQAWQAPLGPAWLSVPPPVPQTLVLSSAGELLAVDPTGLTAYFANKAVARSGAPWPQQGGDSSNRNCVPP